MFYRDAYRSYNTYGSRLDVFANTQSQINDLNVNCSNNYNEDLQMQIAMQMSMDQQYATQQIKLAGEWQAYQKILPDKLSRRSSKKVLQKHHNALSKDGSSPQKPLIGDDGQKVDSTLQSYELQSPDKQNILKRVALIFQKQASGLQSNLLHTSSHTDVDLNSLFQERAQLNNLEIEKLNSIGHEESLKQQLAPQNDTTNTSSFQQLTEGKDSSTYAQGTKQEVLAIEEHRKDFQPQIFNKSTKQIQTKEEQLQKIPLYASIRLLQAKNGIKRAGSQMTLNRNSQNMKKDLFKGNSIYDSAYQNRSFTESGYIKKEDSCIQYQGKQFEDTQKLFEDTQKVFEDTQKLFEDNQNYIISNQIHREYSNKQINENNYQSNQSIDVQKSYQAFPEINMAISQPIQRQQKELTQQNFNISQKDLALEREEEFESEHCFDTYSGYNTDDIVNIRKRALLSAPVELQYGLDHQTPKQASVIRTQSIGSTVAINKNIASDQQLPKNRASSLLLDSLKFLSFKKLCLQPEAVEQSPPNQQLLLSKQAKDVKLEEGIKDDIKGGRSFNKNTEHMEQKKSNNPLSTLLMKNEGGYKYQVHNNSFFNLGKNNTSQNAAQMKVQVQTSQRDEQAPQENNGKDSQNQNQIEQTIKQQKYEKQQRQQYEKLGFQQIKVGVQNKFYENNLNIQGSKETNDGIDKSQYNKINGTSAYDRNNSSTITTKRLVKNNSDNSFNIQKIYNNSSSSKNYDINIKSTSNAKNSSTNLNCSDNRSEYIAFNQTISNQAQMQLQENGLINSMSQNFQNNTLMTAFNIPNVKVRQQNSTPQNNSHMKQQFKGTFLRDQLNGKFQQKSKQQGSFSRSPRNKDMSQPQDTPLGKDSNNQLQSQDRIQSSSIQDILNTQWLKKTFLCNSVDVTNNHLEAENNLFQSFEKKVDLQNNATEKLIPSARQHSDQQEHPKRIFTYLETSQKPKQNEDTPKSDKVKQKRRQKKVELTKNSLTQSIEKNQRQVHGKIKSQDQSVQPLYDNLNPKYNNTPSRGSFFNKFNQQLILPNKFTATFFNVK